MMGHRVLKIWKATKIINITDTVTVKNIPKKSISYPKCKTELKSQQKAIAASKQMTSKQKEDRFFPFLL